MNTNTLKNILMDVIYILPKNLLSRLVGNLVAIEWGKVLGTDLGDPLNAWLINNFARIYKIKIQEAELPIGQYPSIGKFFTRKLRPGLRPQGESPLNSPADGVISQIGAIKHGELMQAKDKFYSLKDFLRSSEAEQVFDGGFFMTCYLCPTDYHRVHSPVKGTILSVKHVPGTLWPVNEWSVERIDQLFCVNERVIIDIQTVNGMVALVLVGATNVGKISLSFEPRVISNQKSIDGLEKGGRHSQKIYYSPGKEIEQGDELGIFHMGSTVVLVGAVSWFGLMLPTQLQERLSSLKGKAVKVGESLWK